MPQLIPFRELYSCIPICTSEFNVADLFIAICDGLYEDYFQSEDQSRDKEFIRLLSLKLSSEIYSCIQGQSFNSYAEFKNYLWSVVSPEISIEDAILSLYNIKIKPGESIRDFGSRVKNALQVLNTTYSIKLDGNLPTSLRTTNNKIAIEIFANSIKDEDIRILLLTRNFTNFISAINFAERRLNSYEFYYDNPDDFEDQIYSNTQDTFKLLQMSQDFDYPDDSNHSINSEQPNLSEDFENTPCLFHDHNESSRIEQVQEDIDFETFNIHLHENSSFDNLSNSEKLEMACKSNVAPAVDHTDPITIPSYSFPNHSYPNLLNIYASVSERILHFVIDLNSPYSFINLNCLQSDTQVAFRNTINIRGIANEAIEKTLGTITPQIGFQPNQLNISAKLHILPKHQFPYDGIFGRDLLNSLGADIYMKDRKIIFNTLNLIVSFSDQSVQSLLLYTEESQHSEFQNQNKCDETNIANASFSIPYELDNHKNHDTARSANTHEIKTLTNESTIAFAPNSNLIAEIDDLNIPYEAMTASKDENRTDTVVIYCITHNFSPHKEFNFSQSSVDQLK